MARNGILTLRFLSAMDFSEATAAARPSCTMAATANGLTSCGFHFASRLRIDCNSCRRFAVVLG